MGDEVYRGGAFDPYNSAETSAKWRILLAQREAARRRLLAELLRVFKENAGTLVDAFRSAYARALRGLK